MAILKLVFAVASLLLTTIVFSATISTVNDELIRHGLPPGILPDSVIGYSLGDNGDFEVDLSSPCYVKFTDLVYYDKKIKGKLTYGLISDLNGIHVKKLFAWLPITGIHARPDGKALDIQVGFLSEVIPTSFFEKIPHCRSGERSSRGFWGSVSEA